MLPLERWDLQQVGSLSQCCCAIRCPPLPRRWHGTRHRHARGITCASENRSEEAKCSRTVSLAAGGVVLPSAVSVLALDLLIDTGAHTSDMRRRRAVKETDTPPLPAFASAAWAAVPVATVSIAA